MGPMYDSQSTPNHDSAIKFPDHVDDFIWTEKDAGVLVGPFVDPPFVPWVHISPLMSRAKADPSKRRIITDLTFPRDKSINAYILKNSAMGLIREHSLPTIADLVEELKDTGPNSYLFTVDIARAYKNFVADPLDWPLLCLSWGGQHYADLSKPFGARASSCFMQRVANLVTRILRKEGIRAIMYLDDVIVVVPDEPTASRHYVRVHDLLRELGLPEAIDKTQSPATRVRWLGIDIDTANMILFIPTDKLQDVREAEDRYSKAASINKQQLQSLVGKLLHVAKCVEPARVFISRLLDSLRSFGDRHFIKVTSAMRADLAWFREFMSEWNGRSIIPARHPHWAIQVDACLTGVGGTDGHRAYSTRVAPNIDPAANITELEAVNIIIALHTFLSQEDDGGHIVVYCDNLPAVQPFTSGRAHKSVLADCARALWMIQAKHALKLSFIHIPGILNLVADALSRAHTTTAYRALADEYIATNSLTIETPCTYILANIHPPLLTRSGVELASGESEAQADHGAGSRDAGSAQGDGGRSGNILRTIQHGPATDVRTQRVYVDRVYEHEGHFPRHHKEQGIACPGVREAGRGIINWLQSPESLSGHGGGGAAKGLSISGQGPHPTRAAQGGTGAHPTYGRRDDDEGRTATPILRQSEVAPPTVKTFDPDRHLTKGDVSLGQVLQVRIKWGKNLQRFDQTKRVTLHPTQDPVTCPLMAIAQVLTATQGLPSSAPLLVFTTTMTSMPASHLCTQWARILRGMGVSPTKYSLYSIRKASATTAYGEGCSELEVQ